jgi:hypothetical protein
LKSGGALSLLQWELEGSNDGRAWTSLDARNTQELNGALIVKIFRCSSKNRSKEFRYIRLRQTGKNGSNAARVPSNELALCNIEFFGWLRRTPNK